MKFEITLNLVVTMKSFAATFFETVSKTSLTRQNGRLSDPNGEAPNEH